MKTWEMIKELTEHPEKKFKRSEWKDDNHIETDFFGRVINEDREPPAIYVGDDWEEIIEPVDFMTAVKSGKRVRVEHSVYDTPSNYKSLDLTLVQIAHGRGPDTVRDIILNVKWYIEP